MHAAVLRYVDAVARFGSVRRASQELNISASAINRQILQLEERLGLELFERRASGLKATENGLLIVEHVRRTLHDFDAVLSEIGEAQGQLTGQVRIATLDSLTVHILPRAIIEFRKQHPGVSFRIVTSDPAGVTRQVSNDSADIGLTFESQAHPGLAVLNKVPANLCAVMHTEHPLAKAKHLSIFDCLAHDIILQEDSSRVGAFLGVEVEAATRESEPFLITNTIVASKGLILRGAGIGFFTRFGFIQELQAGTLVAVPLVEDKPASLALVTIIAATRRVSRAVEVFAGCLSRILDDETSQVSPLSR